MSATHLIAFNSTWNSDYELTVRAVDGDQIGTQPDGLPIMRPSSELEVEASHRDGDDKISIYLDKYDVFELISKLNEWYHQ